MIQERKCLKKVKHHQQIQIEEAENCVMIKAEPLKQERKEF